MELRKYVPLAMDEAKLGDKVIREVDTRVLYRVRPNAAAQGAQESMRSSRMCGGVCDFWFGIGTAVALPLALVPVLGYGRGSTGKSGPLRCH